MFPLKSKYLSDGKLILTARKDKTNGSLQPKSLHAEEFINHEEILETLEYADKNKHNEALIREILEKARPRKSGNETRCAGLSHREASVLLACDIPELNRRCTVSRRR